MPRRLLITGGAGLLALNWAAAVRDRIGVVLGMHRRAVGLENVSSDTLDLESEEGLICALERIKPDIVVHTAGMTSVEQCEADPLLARHVNAELPEIVAKACFRLGLKLAHVSTDHLFSGDEPLRDEANPIAPVNTYGRTKAEAEKRVLDAHPEALVVRTNFFGWGTSYRQSFSDMVIDQLRAGKEMTLFEDVHYTPILAEAVAFAVHDLLDRGASGIFNVVGDDRVSKCEFGIELAARFGLNRNLIKQGLIGERKGLVKRPLDMSLSNRKACDILGRGLGGVTRYVGRLREQEQLGLARELKSL